MLLPNGYTTYEADSVLVGRLVTPIANRNGILKDILYFARPVYTTADIELNVDVPMLLLAVIRSTTSNTVWYQFMDSNGNVAWEWYGGVLSTAVLLRLVL